MNGATSRRLRRVLAGPLALVGAVTVPVSAVDIDHGELAAAIRTAGHPCARVLEVTSARSSTWVVRCNSGLFIVSASLDGYTVTPG